jgi:hypothetical protein
MRNVEARPFAPNGSTFEFASIAGIAAFTRGHSTWSDYDQWRICFSVDGGGRRECLNSGLSLTLEKIKKGPIMGQLRNPHPGKF